jgi:hypothetical protein
MSKPNKAPRFPCRIDVAVPDEIARAFELLAADGMLTVSDHVRQACKFYLTQMGALAPPRVAAPNGKTTTTEAAHA